MSRRGEREGSGRWSGRGSERDNGSGAVRLIKNRR